MADRIRVLVVEDAPADAEIAVRELERAGFDPEWERVETEVAFRARLRPDLDVILADNRLPRFDGLAALRVLKESGLDVPLVIVTGSIDEETAVACMREGAADYLLKDRLARLGEAVRHAMRQRDLLRTHRRMERDLRRTERELHHSQKLDALGRLAGGVAHDVNNLLAVISACVDLLSESETLGEPERRWVEEIRTVTVRGHTLTKQLLAFSRSHAGDPSARDLNAIVSEALRLLRRLIGENIEVVTHLEPELAAVWVEPGQMDQVLLNLVVNARDAMPSGGRLEISTANVDFDGERVRERSAATASHVRLRVRDNGIGLDAETRERMFEPFFTTKPTGRGTGLGLSTVFGIVSQCGGRILVRSEPGAGATFDVLLPRADRAVEPPDRDAPAHLARGDGETVLLVEDDETLRRLLHTLLTRLGYRVVEAASGSEALRRLDEGAAFDLVVTDMVMPQMDGLTLVEALRRRRPGLPVLLVSGYFDGDLTPGALPPAAVFLHKPFGLAEIARALRTLLREGGS